MARGHKSKPAETDDREVSTKQYRLLVRASRRLLSEGCWEKRDSRTFTVSYLLVGGGLGLD